MSDERQPYRVFETEREYREHTARVVGWRIGREQDRTRKAERRAEAAEREVERLKQEVRADGRRPRDDDGIRDLLWG